MMTIVLLVVIFGLIGCSAQLESSSSVRAPIPNNEFVVIDGSLYIDEARDIKVDQDGYIYITGKSTSNIGGSEHFGGEDVVLAKYDSNGNRVKIKFFGTETNDSALAFAMDAGMNFYIAGTTYGNLGGKPIVSPQDIFVTKFDSHFNPLWTTLYGAIGSDAAQDIVLDNAGNIYICGACYGNLDGQTQIDKSDAFVSKLDNNGNILWTRQFGSAEWDFAYGIAIDPNDNIYVTGSVSNIEGIETAGDYDAFLAKYDANGNRQYLKLFGGLYDETAHKIAYFNGNCYIVGITRSEFGGQTLAGNRDIFVLSVKAEDGSLNWVRIFGKEEFDFGYNITVSESGKIYVVGKMFCSTNSSLDMHGIVVVEMSLSGEETGRKYFNSEKLDSGWAVDTDHSGNIYLTGFLGSNYNEAVHPGPIGSENIVIIKTHF